MPFVLQTETPPIREDATGALRVGESRVLLELVLRAYQDGATPEVVVRRYPTVALADVYAVIGYYLHHREEIDAYLTGREQVAREVHQKITAAQKDLTGIRERLEARRS